MWNGRGPSLTEFLDVRKGGFRKKKKPRERSMWKGRRKVHIASLIFVKEGGDEATRPSRPQGLRERTRKGRLGIRELLKVPYYAGERGQRKLLNFGITESKNLLGLLDSYKRDAGKTAEGKAPRAATAGKKKTDRKKRRQQKKKQTGKKLS